MFIEKPPNRWISSEIPLFSREFHSSLDGKSPIYSLIFLGHSIFGTFLGDFPSKFLPNSSKFFFWGTFWNHFPHSGHGRILSSWTMIFDVSMGLKIDIKHHENHRYLTHWNPWFLTIDGDSCVVSGGEDEAGRHGGGGRVHLEQRGAAVRGRLPGAGREGRLERCLLTTRNGDGWYDMMEMFGWG